MERLRLYIKESYNELMYNVTWPSFSSLQKNTVLVLIGSVIFALVILGMDLVWKTGTDFIYGRGVAQ
ncbi:MAG: preprotein translocase subunit SecE [Bacteroidota bacterium]